MTKEIIDIILAAGALLAALAVAVVCGVGLVVWLAGGKPDHGKDRKAAKLLHAWRQAGGL